MNNDQNKKSAVAQDEEKVLSFWNENKMFEQSLEKDSPKGEYVFYDGPPFATGIPHYGHLLASTIKDAVPRYQTMRGFHVERRWGWDTHGLPIENIIEKKLDISGKKQIEEIGVAKFNECARGQVLEFASQWETVVDRLGRWVDFKGSYKTMDTSYTESVWWALGEINKKGLLYEGERVLPYCARCETPISNSEIAMDNSYKDVTEPSVYVKFELEDESGTFLLAWTTTPWTLPGHSALYVNKDFQYVKVAQGDSKYILAKDRTDILEGEFEVVKELEAKDLVGKKYKPPFDYMNGVDEKHFHVDLADFVTLEQGTGIVHSAIRHGEVDYDRAKEQGLKSKPMLDGQGHFMDFVEIVKGKFFKQANPIILKDLEERSLAYKIETITHSYPHCHRCDTPLYYNAISAWFINIQKVKDKLIKKNKDINWIPEHLRDGRFHKILEGAPDWNISRNRYWASPLPIWKSADGDMEMLSSVEDIKDKTKSTNTYTLLRHGEAESNKNGTVSSLKENLDHLTEKGKEQVENACKDLKKKDIDLIIASPFVRTKETADIVKEKLGLSDEQLIFDDRLGEINLPSFNGKKWQDYKEKFDIENHGYFKDMPEGGETYYDVKKRAGDFLYEIDKKYKDKNILIVSHGLVLTMLHASSEGMDFDQTVKMYDEFKYSYKNAQVGVIDFSWLPHNASYEIDLHRPYIDELTFEKNGKEYRRIPEVVDCWVESGSMPFAQNHYPFENKNKFEKTHPGQFVAEYIAQTRTWFYYSHVLSTILFDEIPYENIVTTGTILAEDGSKMSKSKNNFPDPTLVFDKYGVDAVRFYMLNSPLMKSEDLNFSEKGVDEVYKKLIMRLKNILTFYEMYKDLALKAGTELISENILDIWVLNRLNQVHSEVTKSMEAYELDRATRPILEFVDDLSTWYVRRSRDRVKGESVRDSLDVLLTLRFVLLETAKLIAPFTPFLAEEIYQQVIESYFKHQSVSVHLTHWSDVKKYDENILTTMDAVRDIVTKALLARDEVGIKVRQPLQNLSLKDTRKSLQTEAVQQIIKEEVNVKQIWFNGDLEKDCVLDTHITKDLELEGAARELVRHIQSLRKKNGLYPCDQIKVKIDTNDFGKEVVSVHDIEIRRITGATEIMFDQVEGDTIKLFGENTATVAIKQVPSV